MLLPALNQARSRAKNATCSNNLRQIGLSMIMYAGDNRDMVITHWSQGGNTFRWYRYLIGGSISDSSSATIITPVGGGYGLGSNVLVCPASRSPKFRVVNDGFVYAAQTSTGLSWLGWGQGQYYMVGYGQPGFDRNQTICFTLNKLAKAQQERKIKFPLLAESVYPASSVNAGYSAGFYSINSTGFAASLNHSSRMNNIQIDGHVENINRNTLQKEYGWTAGIINVGGSDFVL